MVAGQDVTGLLGRARGGDSAALDQLFEIIYDDLKRIAKAAEWDGRRNPTLNATAIVNELCLKWLSNGLPKLDVVNRRTFFTTAARAVQGLLIEHARRRKTLRGGGALQRVPLDDEIAAGAESPAVLIEQKLDHEALAAALDNLRSESSRQAEVVLLRYYAGQNYEQIAHLLKVNEQTARRDWKAARAYLKRLLSRKE